MTVENKIPRDDLLISICFSNLSSNNFDLSIILDICKNIKKNFKFFEFIFILKEENDIFFSSLLKTIPNLRLIFIRDNINSYEERYISASQSIGDIILIVDLTQTNIDYILMIEESFNKNNIVIGRRINLSKIDIMFSRFMNFLGILSGFYCGIDLGPTLAIPRNLVGIIMQEVDKDLAFRFIPRHRGINISYLDENEKIKNHYSFFVTEQRMGLVYKLILNVAPLVLKFVTLASSLLSIFGIFSIIYILIILIFKNNIASGWLTISFALAFISTLTGMLFFGLSIGLQRILFSQTSDANSGIVTELGRSDIYGDIRSELNIDSQKWEN